MFGLAAGAVLLASATWVACESETSGAPSSGGADAGGGTAGTGGPSWGGGGAASGGGGSGGSGGSAGDGGIDWGADPKWESTGQSAAGCPIERLANPKDVKAFAWKACAWSANCEEAAFNPKLVGTDPGFSASVRDDGKVTRVAFAFTFSKIVTIVSDSAGDMLTALRGAEGPEKCVLAAASVWGNRFAVLVTQLGLKSYGGILGEPSTATESVFTLASPPPGGPQRTPLGEKRWLWWWVPVDRFSTVSATDGSDFVMFAKAEQPGFALDYGDPISTGALFLFDEYQAQEAGLPQRVIAYSDGKTAPLTYLKPSAVGDDYGSPAFANSQVGFFRGVNRIQENLYGSVELWSTPYSENPQQLAPKKIADVALTSFGMARAGGWGRFAFPAFSPTYGKQEILVWNLESSDSASRVLPADHDVKEILGISRDHVYIAAAKPNAGPSAYLVRYPVP